MGASGNTRRGLAALAACMTVAAFAGAARAEDARLYELRTYHAAPGKFEALKTGTVNVATFLKESDKSGTVAQGKVADLILLDANPLTDIANSTKINGVMVQGRWLPKVEIDRKLAALVN